MSREKTLLLFHHSGGPGVYVDPSDEEMLTTSFSLYSFSTEYFIDKQLTNRLKCFFEIQCQCHKFLTRTDLTTLLFLRHFLFHENLEARVLYQA